MYVRVGTMNMGGDTFTTNFKIVQLVYREHIVSPGRVSSAFQRWLLERTTSATASIIVTKLTDEEVLSLNPQAQFEQWEIIPDDNNYCAFLEKSLEAHVHYKVSDMNGNVEYATIRTEHNYDKYQLLLTLKEQLNSGRTVEFRLIPFEVLMCKRKPIYKFVALMKGFPEGTDYNLYDDE